MVWIRIHLEISRNASSSFLERNGSEKKRTEAELEKLKDEYDSFVTGLLEQLSQAVLIKGYHVRSGGIYGIRIMWVIVQRDLLTGNERNYLGVQLLISENCTPCGFLCANFHSSFAKDSIEFEDSARVETGLSREDLIKALEKLLGYD
jgi:hypothetical protein